MRLDLAAGTVEQRHQLRRELDEALTEQIDAGASSIEIEFSPPAHDETFRIHIWSDVMEYPTAIVVLRGGSAA